MITEARFQLFGSLPSPRHVLNNIGEHLTYVFPAAVMLSLSGALFHPQLVDVEGRSINFNVILCICREGCP